MMCEKLAEGCGNIVLTFDAQVEERRPEWNGEAQRPVDVGSARTEVKRRPRTFESGNGVEQKRDGVLKVQWTFVSTDRSGTEKLNVRWTLALRRPKRSEDTNPFESGRTRLIQKGDILMDIPFLY